MCSRRLKQAQFGRTYGPKIRCIDPLDGCACMITSRMLNALRSVRVYAVIISKYATKIVGTQKRQVACVHGTQDQRQSTFSTFKPAQ